MALKNSITQQEYLQLIGLETLAHKHLAIVEQCRDAMTEIVGDIGRDYASDVVFDTDRSVDWMLKRSEIVVGG